MKKNLSVWNKLFIAFVVLWTIFSIVIITDVFHVISQDWHKIEKDAIEKTKDTEEQKLEHSIAYELMKEEKRHARFLFLQLWFLPIVLVYCLGHITRWIAQEYGKEKVVAE